MTTPHDPASTKRFYDRISMAYDLLSDASEAAARDEGLRMLDVQPDEQVLEIGYGTGHSIVILAEAVGERGSVQGIDISRGMFEQAHRRVEAAGMTDQVHLQVKAAPPLPQADDSLDAVWMSFTLELFAEDVLPTMLGEIRRVLKPGGRLGVTTMAIPKEEQHRESLIERAYHWMHHHFPHIVDCRPIPVSELLSDTGFEERQRIDMEVWTLPVAAVLAVSP